MPKLDDVSLTLKNSFFLSVRLSREGNQAFRDTMSALENHPRVRGLSFTSFLILPFQRITRLKLLVQVSLPVWPNLFLNLLICFYLFISLLWNFLGTFLSQNILKKAEENSKRETNAIKAHQQLEQVSVLFFQHPLFSDICFIMYFICELKKTISLLFVVLMGRLFTCVSDQIVKECNEGVRKMGRTEELIRIEKTLEFKSKVSTLMLQFSTGLKYIELRLLTWATRQHDILVFYLFFFFL